MDFEGALIDLTQAIQINERYAKPYGHRAFSYLMLDKLELAIADNQKAMELDPEYNRPYFNLGLIEEKQGNMQAACEAWKKAVELGFEEAQEKVEEFCGG